MITEFKNVNRCRDCLYRSNKMYIKYNCTKQDNKSISLQDLACDMFKSTYNNIPSELTQIEIVNNLI